MKERLTLPRGLDGWVWRYHFARQHVLRVHQHDELELNLVVAGRARYLVGDRRYDLRRNTLIWLFPEQDHVLLDQSSDYEMWIAVFRPPLLRRMCQDDYTRALLRSDPPGSFSRQLPERAGRRLEALFAELAAAKDDAARFNAGIAYALLSAWAGHLASADEPAGAVDLHPAVETAARVIRNEHEDMLSLGELAERSGLSPSRLSRLFKRQTGISIVRYRQRILLERFLRLWGGDSAAENTMQLALRAGFGSYPQFHRVFRQLMGCSPAEHLRRARAT